MDEINDILTSILIEVELKIAKNTNYRKKVWSAKTEKLFIGFLGPFKTYYSQAFDTFLSKTINDQKLNNF